MDAKDVWSGVVKIATALRKPLRLWVLRPLVTVVAAFATTSVMAIYAGWTSARDIWNSDTWKDQ